MNNISNLLDNYGLTSPYYKIIFYNTILITIPIYFIKNFLKNNILISIRNFFIQLDIVITLIPLISSITLYFNCYSNVILFVTIILEKRFVFPDTLWVLFPLELSSLFILLITIKFIIIKKNTVFLNSNSIITSYITTNTESNDNDNIDSIAITNDKPLKIYSYGGILNKISLIVLLLFNLYILMYLAEFKIGCEYIKKYYDLRNRPWVHHINYCWDYNNNNNDELTTTTNNNNNNYYTNYIVVFNFFCFFIIFLLYQTSMIL